MLTTYIVFITKWRHKLLSIFITMFKFQLLSKKLFINEKDADPWYIGWEKVLIYIQRFRYKRNIWNICFARKGYRLFSYAYLSSLVSEKSRYYVVHRNTRLTVTSRWKTKLCSEPGNKYCILNFNRILITFLEDRKENSRITLGFIYLEERGGCNWLGNMFNGELSYLQCWTFGFWYQKVSYG